MTLNEAKPAPERTSARRGATDGAIEAGERLLEAGGKVGNACADAYQEAVVNMADFREKFIDPEAIDWAKLMQPAGPLATSTRAKPLRAAGKTLSRVNEQVLDASMEFGLAYVDACEQAVLSVVDLSEQAGGASDGEWLRSFALTQAGLARDVTRACGDAARRLLA